MATNGYITEEELTQELLEKIDLSDLGTAPCDVEIQGRTLINLLGRKGSAIYKQGFESIWATSNEFVTDKFVCTVTDADQSTAPANSGWNVDVEEGKYYISMSEIMITSKNTNAAALFCAWNNALVSGLKTYLANISDTYGVSYGAIKAIKTGKLTFSNIFYNALPGDKLEIRNCRIYEIPKEIYDKIGKDSEYIGTSVTEKFPYVDDIKCVINPYIECNENILDGMQMVSGSFIPDGTPVEEINSGSIHTGIIVNKGDILRPYIETPFNIDYLYGYICAGGTDYSGSAHINRNNTWTIPATGELKIYVTEPDLGGTKIGDFIESYNKGETRITITKGPIRKSYDECHNSRMMFETNLYEGEKITRDNSGKYVKNSEWGEINLLEDLNNLSAYNNHADNRPCKQIKAISKTLGNTEIVQNDTFWVRYDGKVSDITWWVLAEEHAYNIEDGFYINLPNNLTGWGDDYSPAPEEIRAFFLGWRMYLKGAPIGDKLYNGTGDKGWIKLWSGIGTIDSNVTGVNCVYEPILPIICPTTMNDQGYTPYRLIYKKIAPTNEEVKTHGLLICKDGIDITASSGLVLGESHYEHIDGNKRYFNGLKIPDMSTKAKHRVDNVLAVYNDKTKVRFDIGLYTKEWRIACGLVNVSYDIEYDNSLVDYLIYKPDTVTSFGVTITRPSNTRGTLVKIIEELSNTNNKLSTENMNLHNKVETLSHMSNPNLLINGDFQVWQRGEVIDTSGKSGRAYGPDRWVATTSSTSPSIVGSIMKKIPNGILMTRDVNGNAYLRQRVERSELNKLAGKAITFSVKCKGENILLQVYDRLNKKATHNAPIIKYASNDVISLVIPSFNFGQDVKDLEFSICANIGNGDIEVEYAKLEVGDTATPLISRPYVEELTLCQRYYEVMDGKTGRLFSQPRLVVDNFIEYGIEYVEKRTNPTIDVTNMNIGNKHGVIKDFIASIVEIGTCRATVRMTKPSHGVTDAFHYLRQDGSTSISIDSEIYY